MNSVDSGITGDVPTREQKGGDILGTPMFANKIHGTKVYLPIDECLIF